jgi:hypothetical protein
MIRLAALVAALFFGACESAQLYDGDRDPFARLIEVMEPMDISPADKQVPLPLARPKALSAAPLALPAAPSRVAPTPSASPSLSLEPAVPEKRVDKAYPYASKTPVPKAAPAPLAEPQAEPAPFAEPLAEPTPFAEPLAAPAPLAEPQAEPAPFAEPLAEPAPFAEPLAEPAPFAEPLAEPAPFTEPLAEPAPSAKAEPIDEPKGPTARERGRNIVARSNRSAEARPDPPSAFSSLDGQSGSALSANIGGADRPVAPRSSESTRAVISSAKGDLAECYINERLFQDAAQGSVIVVIEVPVELPNRPRIETSDFSETMNACLLDAVRRLPFPGDPSGALYSLRVPFRFRPD